MSLDKCSYFQSLSDSEAEAFSGGQGLPFGPPASPVVTPPVVTPPVGAPAPPVGASATAAGILSQGINRISVDLRDFVSPEFRNQDGLSNSCTANLNAGTLNITCDLQQYVVGSGLVPFSAPVDGSVDLAM